MLRREFLKHISIGAAVVLMPSFSSRLFAEETGTTILLESLTHGKKATANSISFIAPEIAENGLVVPLRVEVDHPMEEENYVKAIHLYATQNPVPKITTVYLTPANGKAYFATKTKLAKSQDVFALAELSDGTFLKSVAYVKVTIGGCG